MVRRQANAGSLTPTRRPTNHITTRPPGTTRSAIVSTRSHTRRARVRSTDADRASTHGRDSLPSRAGMIGFDHHPGGGPMASSDPRQTKFVLDESRTPRAWYNIAADLPVPPSPPLHPGTHQPIGPDDLAPLFPMALIGQEVSTEREIEIPDPVRDAYRLYRPSPLYRAHRLERALDTPAHIYYKYEGVSPAGSHKPNTAIAQAYYNKQEGTRRLTTETGAGQWGTALSFAGALFGIEVKVYQVRASYDQKPYRRSMMETWGASVHRSPSSITEAGRSQA